MLQVLLVDDEPYVLEGLKTMVDWSAYGFSVLEASNGEDAFQIIRHDNPELVITDIKMPVMDGIELIRLAIEKLHSTAEFVILSGYDDFSFARKAMLYNVSDYLLKPLDNEELDKLVSKITLQIYEKKRKADSDSSQLSFIAGQCIRRLIKGETNDSLCKRIRMLLSVGEEEAVRCALIDPETGTGDPEKTGEIRRLIESRLGAAFRMHLFEDDMGRMGLMATTGMPFYESLSAFLRDLIRDIKAVTGGSPTASVSLPGQGPGSFPEIYRQALAALHYRFFVGDGQVIDYRDIQNIRLDRGLCTMDQNALLESVRNGNDAKIVSAVDRLFARFSENRRAPGSILAYLKCFDLEIVKLIMETGGDADEFSRSALTQEREMERLTFSELKGSFLSHCRYACAYIQSMRLISPHAVVNEMKDYIRQNYRKNIKLKQVARVFNMNPVYLGQVFAKSTGMPFTGYVNTLRIEEAQKLLRTSDMQIQEVARAVGFKDAKYFTDKFKAVTSLPPSAFKGRI